MISNCCLNQRNDSLEDHSNLRSPKYWNRNRLQLISVTAFHITATAVVHNYNIFGKVIVIVIDYAHTVIAIIYDYKSFQSVSHNLKVIHLKTTLYCILHARTIIMVKYIELCTICSKALKNRLATDQFLLTCVPSMSTNELFSSSMTNKCHKSK